MCFQDWLSGIHPPSLMYTLCNESLGMSRHLMWVTIDGGGPRTATPIGSPGTHTSGQDLRSNLSYRYRHRLTVPNPIWDLKLKF